MRKMIKGGCLCGKIRYEFKQEDVLAGIIIAKIVKKQQVVEKLQLFTFHQKFENK